MTLTAACDFHHVPSPYFTVVNFSHVDIRWLFYLPKQFISSQHQSSTFSQSCVSWFSLFGERQLPLAGSSNWTETFFTICLLLVKIYHTKICGNCTYPTKKARTKGLIKDWIRKCKILITLVGKLLYQSQSFTLPKLFLHSEQQLQSKNISTAACSQYIKLPKYCRCMYNTCKCPTHQFHLYADLLHSDSPPAAPMHTCPPSTGTSAGHPSGRCCVRKRWNSCTAAGSCPGSRCSALGWKCRLLGCACSS